ncbi:hypothetical protein JTE90_019497 [Oedothorax gibbosus]|uniref:Uncharacterized protein n=1 Tax=Oedothorax gibbosus TaxID=931172 RepID=A0AAV6UJH2_9ARAC|nr:hypothetical protein JTE90_019497 [Oedothorax gibbosus]
MLIRLPNAKKLLNISDPTVLEAIPRTTLGTLEYQRKSNNNTKRCYKQYNCFNVLKLLAVTTYLRPSPELPLEHLNINASPITIQRGATSNTIASMCSAGSDNLPGEILKESSEAASGIW